MHNVANYYSLKDDSILSLYLKDVKSFKQLMQNLCIRLQKKNHLLFDCIKKTRYPIQNRVQLCFIYFTSFIVNLWINTTNGSVI